MDSRALPSQSIYSWSWAHGSFLYLWLGGWLLLVSSLVAQPSPTSFPLAPLEPLDNSKIYFGPWYDRLLGDSPMALNTRMGKSMSLFQSDVNISSTLQADYVDHFFSQVERTGTDAIAYLTVYPMEGFEQVSDGALEDLAKKIANEAIKGRKIFIRYASEMNGNWFPYGQKPKSFLISWKRVVGRIRQVVTDFAAQQQQPKDVERNVAFVWAPNAGYGYPFASGQYLVKNYTEDFYLMDTNKDGILDVRDDPYTVFYPGDEWVDWVGFSIYHYGTVWPWKDNANPSLGKFEAILEGKLDNKILLATNSSSAIATDPAYNFYEMFCRSSLHGGKPFIVTETGATFHIGEGNPPRALPEGPGRVSIKQTWWREFLNSTFLQRYPKLKAVSTFEFIKFEEETWRDFTMMGNNGVFDVSSLSDVTLQAFKSDLNDSSIEHLIRWASPFVPPSTWTNSTVPNGGQPNSKSTNGANPLSWNMYTLSIGFLGCILMWMME